MQVLAQLAERACLCVSRAVYWPGDYDSRFLLSVFTSQRHVFTVFLLRVTLNCEGFVEPLFFLRLLRTKKLDVCLGVRKGVFKITSSFGGSK